jgi:hypothetical protein
MYDLIQRLTYMRNPLFKSLILNHNYLDIKINSVESQHRDLRCYRKGPLIAGLVSQSEEAGAPTLEGPAPGRTPDTEPRAGHGGA